MKTLKLALIGSLLLESCSGNNQNIQQETIEESNNNVEYIEEEKVMIDASKYLNKEEINTLRKLMIKACKIEDYITYDNAFYNDIYSWDIHYYDSTLVCHFTREEIYQSIKIIHKLITKLYPYRPVSDSLFKERLNSVLGFTERTDYRYDGERQVLSDDRFLIYLTENRNDFLFGIEDNDYNDDDDNNNDDEYSTRRRPYPVTHNYDDESIHYTIYPEGKAVLFGVPHRPTHLPFKFELTEEEKTLKKKQEEEIFDDPKTILTMCQPIYDRCIKNGKVLIESEWLEEIFYVNSYIFHGDSVSRIKLETMRDDYIRRNFFETFNYDKDTTLNNHLCIKTRSGKNIINAESFSGTDVYGDTVYREGLMQSMVDNCCEPERKDRFGLINCTLVDILQDALFKALPKNDAEFLEFFSTDGSGKYGKYIDIKLAALLAIYQKKMHDVWVEKTNAKPRCWADYFGMALYNSDKDCESLFYQKLKEENFFGRKELVKIAEEAYQDVRGDFFKNR